MVIGYISFFVFLTAFLYSSVGFGGASSYLAVMSAFNVTPAFASTIALTLNILVAGVAFINYSRRRYFQWALLWPFLISSIPTAFLGGMIRLSRTTYELILNGILLYVAFRLFFLSDNSKIENDNAIHLPAKQLAILLGGVLGLISGMIGIGGGIFYHL